MNMYVYMYMYLFIHIYIYMHTSKVQGTKQTVEDFGFGFQDLGPLLWV